MATLSVTLGITSTDATSESLSIGASDTLTITNPVESTSRASVGTVSAFNILTTAANTSITYVYVSNTDNTNVITLKDDAGNSFLDLSPGEFAFFPVKGTIGLEALANTAPCVLEYGFWTKS
jgi:hypothetical protein